MQRFVGIVFQIEERDNKFKDLEMGMNSVYLRS